MDKKIIKNLSKDIDYLLELNVKFHENFSYGKNSWAQWGEYQEWINYNILSLNTVKTLGLSSLYRESFVLLRSVFESYFLIKLAMLGNYLYFNYLPLKGESKKDLLLRVKKDAKNVFGKEYTKSIKLIENTDRPYKVEVIYKTKPINNTTKTVPRHYFLLKEFDSDACYLSGVKFRDVFRNNKKNKENKKIHKNINRDFLSMPGAILRFLEINKMATKKHEKKRGQVPFLKKEASVFS